VVFVLQVQKFDKIYFDATEKLADILVNNNIEVVYWGWF